MNTQHISNFDNNHKSRKIYFFFDTTTIDKITDEQTHAVWLCVY